MRKILLIISTIVLSSCVSAKITSRKAEDFNEKINKIYILSRGAEDAKYFYKGFFIELEKYFNEENVKFESYRYDKLSLETDKEIDEKINKFSPDVVMLINQTESEKHINAVGIGFTHSTITKGTFDIKIFLPNSEKIVWRGNLTADAAYDNLAQAAEKSVQKLIEKLKLDGLL
ncbi:hypothetical protein QVZ41_13760 [Wenyingzhuangia sp. chi5]|uniref:Lipoprotein n=1 Tax=Wenyingzhuangia gilva TaxID=3057677 RepID=A0ABT8VVF8_9FLAO|nr:hypothetical protein [Wenyingzhuangia sp. chi5]MDO3695912.1 hypothetical protein [Wenyingzhuangia sp. chi5]